MTDVFHVLDFEEPENTNEEEEIKEKKKKEAEYLAFLSDLESEIVMDLNTMLDEIIYNFEKAEDKWKRAEAVEDDEDEQDDLDKEEELQEDDDTWYDDFDYDSIDR